MVRKSRGRQKVEMVKMANDSNLQVTFSKRRSGLFKKASELCTLCGAEVAIIVFSPGRKVFSFGHPCVETVIDHFLSPDAPYHHQTSGTMQLSEAHRNATIWDLNAELTKVTNELEVERKRGGELNKMRKMSQGQFWWESLVEEMDMSQCEQLLESLEELKKAMAKQVERVMITTNHNPFFGEGSSSSHPNLMTNVGFDGMPASMPPHPHPYGWNPGYGHGRFF